MKVICVDDENIMLLGMLRICKEIPGLENCIGFEDSQKALDYVKENPIDLAFLDIDMPILSGLELGKQIKALNEKTQIVFVTGYEEYSLEAYRIHAMGYLVKPISKEDVERELQYLQQFSFRTPQGENMQSENSTEASQQNTQGERTKPRLTVRTFGNFEAFVDGRPVEFERSKTKELLAYLVDREGAACGNNEIATILWEDDENHLSYLRKLSVDLVRTLTDLGCGDVVIKNWGTIAIVPDRIQCDYYEWKKNGSATGNIQHEYMSQYSWAEGRGGTELW